MWGQENRPWLQSVGPPRQVDECPGLHDLCHPSQWSQATMSYSLSVGQPSCPPPAPPHFAGRPASPAVRPRTRAGRPPSLRKHWRSILECSCRHLPRTFNPSALTAPILACRRTLTGPTASWHAWPQHCFFHYTSSPPCQVDAFTSPRHLTVRKHVTKLTQPKDF